MEQNQSLIDFHSHILPGIDDGSRSAAQSLDMMKLELDQGIGRIVATPHFYADKISVDKFLSRRQQAYEKVMAAIDEQGRKAPVFYLGAEVYYFGGIGKAEMLPKLCMGDTDTILLEMPFCQWTKDMLENVEQILDKQKLHIILAHIERYYDYQKKKDIWNAIFDLPITAQINAGSFLNWKKRGRCMKFLKEDWDVLLGSDCHNTETRVPNLAQGREVIAKKLGQARLDEIDELGERILSI